jgi:hypothetical protein
LIVKVAVADLALSIVSVHGAMPVHEPVQPVNDDWPVGVAVRVTIVPAA